MAQNPPPEPNSFDNYIVNQTIYDDSSPSGPIVDTVDNAGSITQTQSDLAGRTIRTIQDYDASGLDANGLPVQADTAEDVTTDYQYDSSGRLVLECLVCFKPFLWHRQ